VATWPPACSTLSWLSWATSTVPSITVTREPLSPLFTLKTVPVTATRQSRVATYRWPEWRLAACTMMAPCSRPMVISLPCSETEKPERSRISTREPSRRRSIASESLAVRMAAPAALARRAQRNAAGVGDAVDQAIGGFDHRFGTGACRTEAVADGEEGEAGGQHQRGRYGPAEYPAWRTTRAWHAAQASL
jgi:hypothetical protein